jgi:hypothetical protein
VFTSKSNDEIKPVANTLRKITSLSIQLYNFAKLSKNKTTIKETATAPSLFIYTCKRRRSDDEEASPVPGQVPDGERIYQLESGIDSIGPSML